MNCKTCQNVLPDLLLEPNAATSAAARAHIATCTACAMELASFEATLTLLDSWEAPEISPYFDQKLAVRLREEESAPPASWWERLRDTVQFGTGRALRPAFAGALALAMLAAGGTVGLTTLTHARPVQASATVNDLQILDKNEQALQQVDQILQENAADDPNQAALPQT